MLKLVVLGVLALSFYFALRFPPVVAVIFALVNVGGDGYGIYWYGESQGLGGFLSFLRVPLIVGACAAFYRILKQKDQCRPLRLSLAVCFMFSLVWTAIGSIAKGAEVFSVPGHMVYSGFAGGVIALAYVSDPRAKTIFTSLVVAELLLSMMMLMLPNSALANLNGTNYLGSRDEFTDTVEVFSGKLARVSSEERLYAQFNNPNTFGLYAVIGIILGLSLVFVAKAGNRAVGIVLLVMGVAAWTQTLTRSATAGAAFGGILSIFAFRRDVFTKVTLAISVISLSVIGLAFAGVLDPLVELYSRAGEDTSFSSRAMAFHSGVDVLLARPVFGAELEFEWIDGITPHQLPIFLGAMYGVLVGVAGMALLFLPPFFAIREFALTGRSSLARHPFSVVFYFTILAMALANNFAAPSLFWIAWAFGIEPLVTPRDQTEHRRPLVRRAPETDASQ